MAPGLVLDLPMTERSGSKAYDRSGKGNHGTLHGPTWVATEKGGGLSFDGDNDYVDCGNDTSLHLYNSSFSITQWINTNNVGQMWQTIHITGELSELGFDLYVHDSKIYFYTYINGTDIQRLWSENIVSDQWYFVAVTREYGTGETILYLDGVKKDSFTAIGTAGGIDNLHQIGGIGVVGSFNGTIEQVCLYNRALTAEQVKRRYEQSQYDYLCSK